MIRSHVSQLNRWRLIIKRAAARLGLARAFGVTADNLDLISLHSVGAVVHLKRDVLNEESPHFVTESIRIEAALFARWLVSKLGSLVRWGASFTLNCRRLRTFFCSASVMAWSKLLRIFMASCGLMRESLMRSSSVSVSARPMLPFATMSVYALLPSPTHHGLHLPAVTIQLVERLVCSRHDFCFFFLSFCFPLVCHLRCSGSVAVGSGKCHSRLAGGDPAD